MTKVAAASGNCYKARKRLAICYNIYIFFSGNPLDFIFQNIEYILQSLSIITKTLRIKKLWGLK